MYHFVNAQIKSFTDYALPPKPTSHLLPSSPPPVLPPHFLGRIQEFYDSFLQNHHHLSGYTRFRFFSENVATPFAGWGQRESYAPDQLTPLLLALGDSDRKFIEGEFQAVRGEEGRRGEGERTREGERIGEEGEREYRGRG